jgi:hypothetical protein
MSVDTAHGRRGGAPAKPPVALLGALRACLILAACLAFARLAHGENGACVALSGELQQGGLVWSRVEPGTAGAVDGVAVDVLPDGLFLLGFDRDAPPNATLRIGSEPACEQTLAIAARSYRISRVEGVPQRTVTPPEDQLERIRRERALVARAKAQRVLEPEWLRQVTIGFEWPVTGRISGVYGSQHFYNGKPGNPHYGVDVAVPTGTPVRAPADGLVTLAEPDLFYSGGTVIIDHGYSLSSSFLHMSRILVEVGERVSRGDLIGEVGATGRATGPHLDWRMSWRDRRVDPQLLVPPMPSP